MISPVMKQKIQGIVTHIVHDLSAPQTVQDKNNDISRSHGWIWLQLGLEPCFLNRVLINDRYEKGGGHCEKEGGETTRATMHFLDAFLFSRDRVRIGGGSNRLNEDENDAKRVNSSMMARRRIGEPVYGTKNEPWWTKKQGCYHLSSPRKHLFDFHNHLVDFFFRLLAHAAFQSPPAITYSNISYVLFRLIQVIAVDFLFFLTLWSLNIF